MKNNLGFLVCAVVLAWFKPSALSGAIVLPPARNITGDADVNTTGDVAKAFHIVESTAAASSVTFPHFAVTEGTQLGTSGDFTLKAETGQLRGATSGLRLRDQPFSIFSAPHRTLLGSAVSSTDRNTIALTISGLAIDQRYFVGCG